MHLYFFSSISNELILSHYRVNWVVTFRPSPSLISTSTARADTLVCWPAASVTIIRQFIWNRSGATDSTLSWKFMADNLCSSPSLLPRDKTIRDVWGILGDYQSRFVQARSSGYSVDLDEITVLSVGAYLRKWIDYIVSILWHHIRKIV